MDLILENLVQNESITPREQAQMLDLKKTLLERVLAETRKGPLQTEYCGQFNISSSLHFSGIDKRLQQEAEILKKSGVIGKGDFYIVNSVVMIIFLEISFGN